MPTVYTQHIFTSIFIGETGHNHTKVDPDPDAQTPFAVDCPSCEPFLVKQGWVYATELVPLTDRQTREQERVEREGNMAVKHVAQALAENAAVMLATGETKKVRRASKPKSAAAG